MCTKIPVYTVLLRQYQSHENLSAETDRRATYQQLKPKVATVGIFGQNIFQEDFATKKNIHKIT